MVYNSLFHSATALGRNRLRFSDNLEGQLYCSGDISRVDSGLSGRGVLGVKSVSNGLHAACIRSIVPLSKSLCKV